MTQRRTAGPRLIPWTGQREFVDLALALNAHGPAPCETSANPDAWWSSSLEVAELAIAICRGCRVIEPCRAYAIAARERLGVWGGLSADERGQQ